MVIFGRDVTRKQLVNVFILLILIIGIPLGVYLTLTKQIFKSGASIGDKTRIELFGNSVANGQTTSRNLKVRLIYVPGSQTTSSTVTTCKGETKTWAQIDSELKVAGFNGPYDHTQQELDAYNRAACPNGAVLPEPVTNCKGESKSWAQLDSELHGANFPGPYDHTQQELDAYNRAACPAIYPPTPAPTPPPPDNSITCNTSAVTPVINPTSVKAGSTFAMSLTGDASTYIGDDFGGANCQATSVSGAGATYNCTAQDTPGSYTWTHSWRHCETDFNHCSATCSVSKNYTVTSAAVLGAKIALNDATPSAFPLPTQLKIPGATCFPRPACLDATPKCEIPEPANGWCPNASLTPHPSATLASSGQSGAFPSNFKLANSLDGLNNASPQIFDSNNKEVDWQLTSGNGQKTVYAQFQVNGVWGDPVSATIILNEGAKVSKFLIGVNAETITSYGFNDLRPFSHTSDIDADLKEISRMGGKIVRVFVANNKITDDEASSRLDSFLTAAQSYNISVIVSLIDFYGSGHNPQGTDSFYTGNFNGIPLLNHDFFATGYKDKYKSFVQNIVAANKNHPNIYAWEPGNELKDDSSPQTFVAFMKDITSLIKNLDPNHSVATGMIQAAHTGLNPDQLYPNLPDVDIITVHPYNGTHDGTEDVTWARQNNKQAIVEETGFAGTADRSQSMKDTISYWQSQNVSALLQWGFIAKGLSDNGDGDRSVGMDTIWHGADYDKLVDLFLSVTSVSQQTNLSCAQCIIGKQINIPDSFQKQGWDTNIANFNNIITNWCSNNQQACSTIRNGACNAACGIGQNNGNQSAKLDETLTELLNDSDKAGFLKQHNLKFTIDKIPVKIVSLDPNFKIPADAGTQTGSDGNVTNATINLDKIQEITSSGSVIQVQFDGPAVSVGQGQTFSSSSSTQTMTETASVSPTTSPAGSSQTGSNTTSSPPPSPGSSSTGQATQTSSPSPANVYDLNGDGKVNSVDVAIFIKNWIAGGNTQTLDFNGDGQINAVDFGKLVKNLSL